MAWVLSREAMWVNRVCRVRYNEPLGHIYRKMGVATHVDAVVAALKAGIVEL